MLASDDKIIDRCTSLLRFCSLVHFFDAFQVINKTKNFQIKKKKQDECKISFFVQISLGGILRAIGGQLYSSINLFISFYLFGLPIGLSLLLLTPLKGFGFFIGFIIGTIILVVLQAIYLIRVNWIQKAKDVNDLILLLYLYLKELIMYDIKLT